VRRPPDGAEASLLRAELVLLGYLVFLLCILLVTGFFIGTFFLVKAFFRRQFCFQPEVFRPRVGS